MSGKIIVSVLGGAVLGVTIAIIGYDGVAPRWMNEGPPEHLVVALVPLLRSMVDVERVHSESIEMHQSEERNPFWAPEAERLISETLTRVATANSFSVLDVDCRTNSCIAILEWASFEEAKNEYMHALHRRYDVRCRRGIVLPEPTDPELPYQATLIFECTKKPGVLNANGSRE